MVIMRANSSVHRRLVLKEECRSSMHQIECSVQYMLVCQDLCSPSPLSHAGVLTTTTASLVALWVVTVTVFGVVSAVLSWQIFKMKQKGMLGHMDDIEVNVSTCS